jgi:hypothetical protein
MNPATDDSRIESSSTILNLGAIGLVVALTVICFFVLRYYRTAQMTAQAKNVAVLFIKSSPNVEKNLGAVIKVTPQSAAKTSGAMPTWKVDFNVSGKKGQGTVDMLVSNNGGNWNIPDAKLDSGGKTVNLL